MSPITVAVAGGTGNIGSHVTRAFLSSEYHPEQVGRVVLLTRDTSSAKAKEFEQLGAELVSVANGITIQQLKGVDVLVSCLSHIASREENDVYAKVAIEAGVKVYFPTEYGLDHRQKDFAHEVWDNKKEHEQLARKLGEGKTKVVCVYTGHFMEDAIGPWFGLDTKHGVYTSVGHPTAKVTLTSKTDIAFSLVRLAILATENPSEVPDKVRISGDAVSYQKIADVMSKESGETITVKVIESPSHFFEDLEEKNHGKGDPLGYIRYINGTGKVDLSQDNQDELVNPNESLWKWKKLADYAKETKGKPWCD